MDYCAALLFVMSSCYVAIVKLISHRSLSFGFKHITLAVVMIAFYTNHVHKLIQSHLDYQYNMRINVCFGLASTLAWFVWAYQSHKRHQSKHVFKAVLALLLMHVALLLEIFDFAPLAFVVDAHACWHLSTIPMPFLWYSFLTDETRLLHRLSL
jgi:hypothetical protein